MQNMKSMHLALKSQVGTGLKGIFMKSVHL
jgi:hypothetical protein